MANFRGLSYSIVGDEKIPSTSLNRQSGLSKVSGFSKLNFGTKPQKGLTFSFSKKKLLKNKLKNLVSIKPKLIDLTEYQSLGFQSSLVGFDEDALLQGNIDKPMSPRLINYVEAYEIAGIRKTMFYTEVNSGLKVGDRVFIINGNYDSDLLIKVDKYKAGRDGYKVLFVDKCQVVLDIDWSEVSPYKQDDDDNFLRVYFVDSIDDFISAEKAITTRGGNFDRKFNVGQNNIIYTNKNYGPITIWDTPTKIVEAPGFFVRTPQPILTIDTTFSSGTGFNVGGQVYAMVKQPNGKIIVGGSFTTYNGIPANKIIRLNVDGSIDTTFNYGTGFNGNVETISIDSTGKIIVGGKFTTYNGSSPFQSRLVRLSSLGVIDSSFMSNLPTFTWTSGQEVITSIQVAPVGGAIAVDSIFISGGFSTLSGQSRGGVALLNQTGSLNITFTPGTGFNGSGNNLVKVIKLQSSTGNLICGGSFTSFNGDNSIRKLVRLTSTGSVDVTFSLAPNGFSTVSSIIIHDIIEGNSGQIIIGGNFVTYNGTDANKMIRFNNDGSVDTSFLSNINNLAIDTEVRRLFLWNTDIYVGGNFSNFSKLFKMSYTGEVDLTTQNVSNFNYTVYDIILDSTNNLLIGGDFSYFNGFETKKIAKLTENNWQNITDKFVQGSFSSALSNTYYNNGRLKVFNGSFTYSINELVEFKKDCVYEFGMAEEPNNYIGTYSTWKLDVAYSKPILTKTNFRDGDFDGEWNVGLFGRQNKKIKWKGNKSTWNTGTILNSEWQKGKINSDFTLLESYYSEIEQNGLPSQKLNGPNNNNRGFNFIIDSTILKAEIENATIINSTLGSTTATFSVLENNLLNISSLYDVIVRKAYFENCSFQNSNLKNSEIRSVRVTNSLLDNVKSVNSWIKKSVTKNSDYIADDIIKILTYDELDINMVPSLGSQPTHKVFKFYVSKKDYERLNQRDAFYVKGLDIVDGQKKLLNFFDKKFKISSWYEYDDTLSSSDEFYKRGVDCAAFLSTPEENSFLYKTTVDLSANATNSIVQENQNKNYSVDIIYSLFDKDNQQVSGINFNRSSNSFQIYSDETILVKYMDGSTMHEEIVVPLSTTYNSKSVYILTNNTSSPYSYIFWDISAAGSLNPGSYEWQHYQSFNSLSGGSGDYYATLGQTGSVPVTSTFSWQTAVDNSVTIQSIEIYNPSPILSQSSNIVNITNAFIIDSDYESGIIERTNWNSGYSINSNNDTNITIQSNEGGFYNLILQTSSSTLLATTGFNNFREINEDVMDLGNIVFLNSVYYDTRGKILSFTISNPGSGYSPQQDVPTISTTGTGSTFDITALGIGAVTSITLTTPGSGYDQGPPATNPLAFFTNVGVFPIPPTVGVGLTVDITVDITGQVIAATISNPGTGYLVNDTVQINPNPNGSGAILNIDTVSNGEIISATLSLGGIQYQVGDIITLDSGNDDAQIQVLSVTGSLTKLPDTYKVINISSNQYELQEVINGTTSLSTLSDGGIFYTPLANNRYGYLHQLKMIKNSIKSGFLKRIYLKNNLIQNSEINLSDKDFNNLLLFKKLVTSDTLFTDNSNILSKASYVQSNFTSGTDYWDDGLFYNSVWNGGTFRKGLIKESSWHDGLFLNGLFYQSRSFNALPNLNYQYYDVDRIKNYWKDGPTTATISNDRYSWRNGTFSNGEFLKSDWEDGNFLKGKIYNSKWYSGTFSSGTIGDKNLSFSDTWFYNGLVKTAIVENAALYGIDTSYYGLSNSTIVWETGTFNDGIFGCDILQQMTASHTATWYDGTFNGGEFRTNGKWITGIFNGGKFISGYGWTYSLTYDTISTSASQFAWETGEFNGGEFGDMGLGTNSTWWTGEFNGGVFQGRYWNDGVFTAGKFKGSGTYSVVGGYSVDSMTESNASLFTDSFSQSFYGIWGAGYVTDVRDEFVKNKKLFTTPVRSLVTNIPRTISTFENILWLGGTFSHPGGSIFNSVWLDGNFRKGKFNNSSFNPWVVRPGDSSRSFNLNDDLINASGSCIWESGTLEESDFYISQWKTGQFISGTAFGMIWKNGVTNYMNAFNVMWENGIWRNGNWNGSYFIFDGDITPEFNKQIVFRGMNWSNSPLLHVWNVFEESIQEEQIIAGTVSGITIVTTQAAIVVVR